MEAELLWLDEDELRQVCLALSEMLVRSEYIRIQEISKALEHGYREGYADAALRVAFAPEERDAESIVLH